MPVAVVVAVDLQERLAAINADNKKQKRNMAAIQKGIQKEATGQAEGLAGDAEVQADTPNAETPEVPEVDTSCIKDAVMGVVGLYSKASEKIKILFTYVQMMSSFPGESLLHLATLSMLTSLNTLTSLPSLIGPLCCRHN